ncbi:MAG: exodeoxyribonuclease III [Desulfobulbaceae bacterium]|nr:exodeoxyribonuclease III [Desulfobulbaceae bacterium]
MSFPIDIVIPRLEKEVRGLEVPVVDLIAAQTQDPFKVLVATILSARTKDEVTAAAARRLFDRAATAQELAALSVAELEKLIYPVGFFRNKARYLNQLPEVLATRFQGAVPSSIEELITLPGVGRKTANLVRSVAFMLPAICVDTHVHRIMNIWGYVQTSTPLQTEMALREKLPQQYWLRINSLLVAFGQAVCRPVAPHCDICCISEHCPRLGVTPRKRNTRGRTAMSVGQHFLSWNVNGLRAAVGKGLLEVIASCNADIVALQEIKAQLDQLPKEVLELQGYRQFWHPAEKKGYAGTAVFSKIEPLQVYYGIGTEDIDREGRVLTLEFDDYYFINTYFPNAQPGLKRMDFKQHFNRAMLEYMNRLRQAKTVVLGGDLNVAHKEIDLARPKENRQNPGFSDEERAWMDTLLAAGYVDTFRQFCQDPGQYTWWSYRSNARERNIGWRIDYFVVDEASGARVRDAAIHSNIFGSDHCPVSIRFT